MQNPDLKEWLLLKRTVRFGETDAAGVVHFLELFKWCHEAWEESLEKFGIVLKDIFPISDKSSNQVTTALPVVHCEAQYFKPVYAGDLIKTELHPKKLSESSFVIGFILKNNGDQVGCANIKHVSINSFTREKCPLPSQINLWLTESTLDF